MGESGTVQGVLCKYGTCGACCLGKHIYRFSPVKPYMLHRTYMTNIQRQLGTSLSVVVQAS